MAIKKKKEITIDDLSKKSDRAVYRFELVELRKRIEVLERKAGKNS